MKPLLNPALEKIHHRSAYLLRIMSYEIMFARQIPLDDGVSKRTFFVLFSEYHGDFVFFPKVFFRKFILYLARVHKNEVEHSFADVPLDDFHKILHLKPVRLSVFRHDVTDVDDFCLRLSERFAHPDSQKIRNDAGIEISGADDDEVGVDDRLSGTRVQNATTGEIRLLDAEIPIMFRHVDIGLSDNFLASLKLYAKLRVIECHGNDFPSYIEHLGEYIDSFLEASGHLGKSCQKKVSDGVSFDATFLEPVIEHLSYSLGVLSKRSNRASRIARREYPELVAELSGASSGIGRSHDSREIGVLQVFESEEHVRASGSASDCGYVAGGFHIGLFWRIFRGSIAKYEDSAIFLQYT